MARVMIVCPTTGGPVWTGMDVAQKTFEREQLGNNQFGSCPECGEAHTWSKEDAYLEEQ